jgi:hypothetical protein
MPRARSLVGASAVWTAARILAVLVEQFDRLGAEPPSEDEIAEAPRVEEQQEILLQVIAQFLSDPSHPRL